MKNNKTQKTNRGDNNFCQDITITDIQLHSTKATNPKSLYRKIEKSIRNGKPGRAFSNQIKLNQNGTFNFSIPALKEKEHSKNKIRLLVPKDGIPVFAGKDLIVKIKSLNQ